MQALSNKEYFVDPDVGRAESLPASAFVEPGFLDLELRTIFDRTWLLVQEQSGSTNLSDILKKPGYRIPVNLLGKPLFLQRGQSGKLSCFPNVCTHAWYPLVESANAGGAIICPQHGRQFDNEGKFVAQAGFEKKGGFPRESDHLEKLHVDEWGPMIFVSTGKPLAPFREFVEKLEESIPGLSLEKLTRHRSKEEIREVDGNWKQHAWNYMDNFHIRFVHKGLGGLSDAIDMPSYRTELFKFSSLQWAYSRDPENGFEHRYLAERFRDPKDSSRRVFALWWFVFPNMAFNFYPWGLSVNVYVPNPGKPEKTCFLWLQYALDEEKFERRNSTWLSNQVDAEDIEAISLVSTGVRSGFAPRGRFSPREETGPHWFHRLVYETAFESNPNK